VHTHTHTHTHTTLTNTPKKKQQQPGTTYFEHFKVIHTIECGRRTKQLIQTEVDPTVQSRSHQVQQRVIVTLMDELFAFRHELGELGLLRRRKRSKKGRRKKKKKEERGGGRIGKVHQHKREGRE
jgi:hypothetical protein